MAKTDRRIQLSRAGSSRPVRTTNVHLAFGDGYEIHILCHDGRTQVVLANTRCSITLEADGPPGQFEQAVNLLRLHLGH